MFASYQPGTIEIFFGDNNKLTGAIPTFPSFKDKSEYYLSGNQFSGSKLPCFCALLTLSRTCIKAELHSADRLCTCARYPSKGCPHHWLSDAGLPRFGALG